MAPCVGSSTHRTGNCRDPCPAGRGAGAGPASTTLGSRQLPVRLRLPGRGLRPQSRSAVWTASRSTTDMLCIPCRRVVLWHSRHSQAWLRCSWGQGLDGALPHALPHMARLRLASLGGTAPLHPSGCALSLPTIAVSRHRDYPAGGFITDCCTDRG